MGEQDCEQGVFCLGKVSLALVTISFVGGIDQQEVC